MASSIRDKTNIRVDVERRTLTQDEVMSDVITWAKIIRNMRCSIQTVRERPDYTDQREQTEITHKLYHQRANAGIIPFTDRIAYGGRTFEVRGSHPAVEGENLFILDLKEET